MTNIVGFKFLPLSPTSVDLCQRGDTLAF